MVFASLIGILAVQRRVFAVFRRRQESPATTENHAARRRRPDTPMVLVMLVMFHCFRLRA